MYVLQDSEGTIWPADRCTWQSTYSSTTDQYEISSPLFYNGSSATGVSLGTAVQLGYIGKSGRFVGISGQ